MPTTDDTLSTDRQGVLPSLLSEQKVWDAVMMSVRRCCSDRADDVAARLRVAAEKGAPVLTSVRKAVNASTGGRQPGLGEFVAAAAEGQILADLSAEAVKRMEHPDDWAGGARAGVEFGLHRLAEGQDRAQAIRNTSQAIYGHPLASLPNRIELMAGAMADMHGTATAAQ